VNFKSGSVARAAMCLLSVITPMLAGCVYRYTATPMEAWVVDAQTGKALEGVIVVASWQAEIHVMGGRVSGEQIRIMESVTDVNGRFTFPEWGPEWVTKGRIEEKSPQLLLFKSGYEFARLHNASEPGSAVRDFDDTTLSSGWSGRRIELKKFSGDTREYAWHLTALTSALETLAGTLEARCDWRRIPLMLRALDAQDAVFRAEKIALLTLASVARAADRFYIAKGCGSATAMLEERS
jgi:hypothetical protein